MTLNETNMTIKYLKKIQESYIEGEGYGRYPLPEWYALEKAIEAIEQTRWIPVTERPPKEFESVLVCYESQGGMAQAVSERFRTHTGYRWSALAGIEPTAWMQLPEPYKAESEDKK